MTIQSIVNSIVEKHIYDGIDVNPPASPKNIADFETKMGFQLPLDFKEFYFTCDGFACNEDIFNMTPLSDIDEYSRATDNKWFYFAEYMISSDMWGLRLTKTGEYEIFNGSYPEKAMTSSLTVFLKVFLKGNVFDEGGLYEWQEELGIK